MVTGYLIHFFLGDLARFGAPACRVFPDHLITFLATNSDQAPTGQRKPDSQFAVGNTRKSYDIFSVFRARATNWLWRSSGVYTLL